jgi:hypothetical protein
VGAPELAAVRLLAGTQDARRPERLLPVLQACDPVALGGALQDQALLALLGSRALGAWGRRDAPPRFREAVEAAVAANRGRGLALEALGAEFVERLDSSGIPALVLKGPLLARRLHGDVGFRRSNDVDLLVRRDELAAATQTLAALGYSLDASAAPPRSHGLPDIHYELRSPTTNLPRLDLHWRVHWYEEQFSADLLARSRTGSSTFLEPEPGDDLATLLLLYARDGFYGLRTAADIAGWWDQHALAQPRPLERHWREYPRLRRAFTAAALATHRAVEIPASELVPEPALADRRSQLAASLARWNQGGEVDQLRANIAVVDALLSPAPELRHFARRQLFVTRDEIEAMYGLPPTAHRRVTALRLIHAPKVAVRYLAGFGSALRARRAITSRIP